MAKTYKKFAKKYYKKKYKKRPSLQKQMLRLSDAKYQSYEWSANGLLHNTIWSVSPLQNIVQGTTNQTRIGDSIYLQNMTISGLVNATALANAALRARIIVGWSSKQIANTTFATPVLGTTDLFQPNTYNFNVSAGVINPRAFTVLSDMVIDINAVVTSARDLKSFYYTVPLNQNFDYIASQSSFGKRKNLFFVVIPFFVTGTGTTTVCDVVASYTVKYKDP